LTQTQSIGDQREADEADEADEDCVELVEAREDAPKALEAKLQDGGDELQLAATVRAVVEVDLESEASAKTHLYSSYVVAKTRLSSRAQLMRAGAGDAHSSPRSATSTAACSSCRRRACAG